MKTPFLKPRFTGPRFEAHPLPVEVAKDLAAYEELIVVRSAQKFYTKEVELVGAVGEIDWEKRSFRLRLENNQPVNALLPDWADGVVRRAGGVERSRVLLKGIGIYDAWDRLLKVWWKVVFQAPRILAAKRADAGADTSTLEAETDRHVCYIP